MFFLFFLQPKDWPSLAEATVESSVTNNEQTVSNDNEPGTSQSNTPRTRKKKGKQKWVPLPFEQQENGEGETATTNTNTNAQNGANRSNTTKATISSKGNRGNRSSRSGRGGSRNRTRSLDGAAPKKSRKNRAAAAAAAAAAYQQNYDAYQDYYPYYCMFRSIYLHSFVVSLDYDQAGQGSNGAAWYHDKQSKRKKKTEGALSVDPNAATGDATSKFFNIFPTQSFVFFSAGSDTADATTSHESAIKRDVHNFIFDDEAVVVDDCSFVLPYIEGAYYYQSTTPPPATDIPLTNVDVNTDEFNTIPLVPAYTEQQLKELLRRQV